MFAFTWFIAGNTFNTRPSAELTAHRSEKAIAIFAHRPPRLKASGSVINNGKASGESWSTFSFGRMAA